MTVIYHYYSTDEEEEFRSFCLNVLVPDDVNVNSEPSCENSKGESLSSPSSTESHKKIHVKNNRTITASTIKRVKPAYVQTLRPESAQVSEDDIRLTYARTFFNTFNGLEQEDLDQKLVTYCVDDVIMSVKWLGEKGNYIVVIYLNIFSILTTIIHYCYYILYCYYIYYC